MAVGKNVKSALSPTAIKNIGSMMHVTQESPNDSETDNRNCIYKSYISKSSKIVLIRSHKKPSKKIQKVVGKKPQKFGSVNYLLSVVISKTAVSNQESTQHASIQMHPTQHFPQKKWKPFKISTSFDTAAMHSFVFLHMHVCNADTLPHESSLWVLDTRPDLPPISQFTYPHFTHHPKTGIYGWKDMTFKTQRPAKPILLQTLMVLFQTEHFLLSLPCIQFKQCGI